MGSSHPGDCLPLAHCLSRTPKLYRHAVCQEIFKQSALLQVDEGSGPLEATCVWSDTASTSLSCSTEVAPCTPHDSNGKHASGRPTQCIHLCGD